MSQRRILYFGSKGKYVVSKLWHCLSLWFLIGVLFTAASAGIGAEVQLELVGQIGGATYAVAVRDGYAYVGVGPRLVILDVSDPARPSPVGQTSVLPGVVTDVEVAGSYAYVADGWNLLIVDVSNPTSPSEVGRWEWCYPRDVEVVGNYAYITDGDGVFRVIDVSDPTYPHEIGHYDVPGGWSVAVAGNYAYVEAGRTGGLWIIDVSDPTYPHKVGHCDAWGLDIAIAETYVYLAAWEAGLLIIDVSDATSPREVGHYSIPEATNVTVAGNYTYVAAEGVLRIINVSDPSSPQEVGSWEAGPFIEDITVAGDHAYIVNRKGSFCIIDVSDPTYPHEVSRYDVPGWCRDVEVAGNYAYVIAADSGLWVLDVTDFASPKVVSHHNHYEHGLLSVAVAKNYAYIVGFGGIGIIDVSDPSHPHEVGHCDVGGVDIVGDGNFAYVAAGGEGLWIIDVSDPTYPYEVGHWEGCYAGDVEVAEKYAYITAGDMGLRIIDVSDPTQPHEVGHVCWEGCYAEDVAVAGDYAYVTLCVASGSECMLRVIDISDPSHPYEVGHCDGGGLDITVVEKYAYIAAGDIGLRIIDVSDPTQPHEVSSYRIPGPAWSVTVAGSYAYIAAEDAGLVILRFEEVEHFGRIQGKVTNAATGEGIAGALVEAQGPIVGPQAQEPMWAQAPFSTVTDEFGNYTLELPEGEYDMRASAEGYEPQVKGVTVIAGETVELNFELTPTAPANRAPIARASDISGQPGTIYPGVSYTVTARYFDLDGREDLKYCYLRLNHPDKPLTMMWYQEDGHAAPWAGEEGENYLTRVEATATEIVDPETGYEGYEIAWTFEINENWPEVENAIDFGVCAIDDSDSSSGWDYDDTNADFVIDTTPPALIQDFSASDGEDSQSTLRWTNPPDDDLARVVVRRRIDGYPSDHTDGDLVYDDTSPIPGALVEHVDTGLTNGMTYYYAVFSRDIRGNWNNQVIEGENANTGTPQEEPWIGYAIIVAGKSAGTWKQTKLKMAIDHCANNAYRVLRNLGFDDNHIFYLNSKTPQDVDNDGEDEVDAPALLSEFVKVVNEARVKIGDNVNAPLIIYLVGHGVDDTAESFVLDEDASTEGFLYVDKLQALLGQFPPAVPMLIVVGSCYSGCFITSTSKGPATISARNRVIITAAHDDQARWSILGFGGWFRTSDRFWANLNEGMSVKDAFVNDTWPGDWWHLWLDDNGDAKGSPPNNLVEDGYLASQMYIGVPGVESLELVPWYLVWKHSPGELRVYDEQGRVTGIVKGQIEEYIPNSMFDSENDVAMIFFPSSFLYYEVVGTCIGVYDLDIISIKGNKCLSFSAVDIPIDFNSIHRYNVDWDVLSRGDKGVLLQIDQDGDGIFERTIRAGSELKGEDFGVVPNDSIVNHGPNPVPPEGCIFWLNLPDDTVEATLKIFDVDGALLVSIPLDPTADRYPETGRWIPRDAQGRLFGTGLYLYLVEIVHADGSVTCSPVQKMVIQR